jgi:biotin transporter BioY
MKKSLAFFWSMIIVLSIPTTCAGVTALPCYANADPRKKERCTSILFLMGSVLGILLLILIVSGEIDM